MLLVFVDRILKKFKKKKKILVLMWVIMFLRSKEVEVYKLLRIVLVTFVVFVRVGRRLLVILFIILVIIIGFLVILDLCIVYFWNKNIYKGGKKKKDD